MPLYIEENYTAVLRKKLRLGDLDAIIIALPFTEPDVVTRTLYQESFKVLLPGKHPWVNKTKVHPHELQEEELLLLGEGHCFRDQVLEACALPTGRPHSRDSGEGGIEASSLETIRHMVASGMGISVLPESALMEQHYAPDLLCSKAFDAPVPSRTVALAWRASFPRPKAIDVLLDALAVCAPLPQEAQL